MGEDFLLSMEPLNQDTAHVLKYKIVLMVDALSWQSHEV
jgi:hypothetical protein